MEVRASSPDVRLALSAVIRQLLAVEHERVAAAPLGVAAAAGEVLREYERDAGRLHALEKALQAVAGGAVQVDLPVAWGQYLAALEAERKHAEEELRAELESGFPERRRIAATRLAAGVSELMGDMAEVLRRRAA